MRNPRSLRLRATLTICLLLVAAVGAFAGTAYQQLRRAALAGASGQLSPTAVQFGALLGSTVSERASEAVQAATDPVLAEALSSPDSATLARAEVALSAGDPAENETPVAVGLRDTEGARVLAVGNNIPREATLSALASARADSAGVGPLVLQDEVPLYPVLAPVAGEQGTIGTLVRWHRLPEARIISSGVKVYLVNATGQAWTNLEGPVEPPPVDLAALPPGGTGTQSRQGQLIATAAVPGTPWLVAVSLPHSLILGGPQRTFGRMILFGLLIVAAGSIAAWLVFGRWTASVQELGRAARAISAGDYTTRTRVVGADEMGMLGSAFNTMAASVQEAHGQLEEKVTELAESEARIRKTRERMEHVIRSSGAILYTYRVAEREMMIDWVSGSVQGLLGYSVADAKTPGVWRRLRHPDDHERLRQGWRRLQEEGRATLEYRLRHADGQYRWVRDQQRLLRDEKGRPKEVVGVLSDISEHRRLEVAREAAEAANRAKNEFLSRMSHELRTPLNSVLGFGQLLQLDVESEANRESIEQILKAGKHLLSLIDEVLDIARIESGQLSLSVEPVSVGSTLQESFDLVRLLAADRDITLRGDGLGCDQFVQADQQRLKQVMLNLLSNAIKYNRRGGVVEVSCKSVGDKRLRIFVYDTGFGISPAKMERLFTPFERLDAEQRGVEGTGLGLALSRGLIEAMGGALGVESEPGEGSRFWVELPLAEPPTISPEVTAEAPDAALHDPLESTHTVLFVEDNLANVRLLERLFQRRPHVRLLTAMQGSLGLQLAREHRPDLILLDLNLPDTPGDVVLRQLQHEPELREIPVIMISGDAIPSQVQRVLDMGASAYITKPFDIHELLNLVDNTLEHRART